MNNSPESVRRCAEYEEGGASPIVLRLRVPVFVASLQWNSIITMESPARTLSPQAMPDISDAQSLQLQLPGAWTVMDTLP